MRLTSPPLLFSHHRSTNSLLSLILSPHLPFAICPFTFWDFLAKKPWIKQDRLTNRLALNQMASLISVIRKQCSTTFLTPSSWSYLCFLERDDRHSSAYVTSWLIGFFMVDSLRKVSWSGILASRWIYLVIGCVLLWVFFFSFFFSFSLMEFISWIERYHLYFDDVYCHLLFFL